MPQVPQLFVEPQSPAPSPSRTPAPVSGHVRRRASKRDRAITSFEMSFAERERLDRVAAKRRTSIASVLRRGVALVDELETLTPAEQELLDRIAAEGGTSIGDVLREGLALVAASRDQTQESAKAA